MEMQEVGKLRRRQDWRDMVVRCQSSGLSVRNWCEQAGMTTSTYYYRQQQVLKLIPDAALVVPEQAAIKPAMAFVRLPAPIDAPRVAPASITIRRGGFCITVEPDVDATTLTTVLESIDRLC